MEDERKKLTREDFTDEEWDWLNMIFKSAHSISEVISETSSNYNYLDKNDLYSLEKKLGIDDISFFSFW